MKTIIDTGPLVALFDPSDPDHRPCKQVLSSLRDTLITTLPVLTEAFHLLRQTRNGEDQLERFVRDADSIDIAFLSPSELWRALDLMVQYRRQGMDFADASLVVTSETLRIRTVFTLDRRDFSVYRPLFGHTKARFRVLP